jgi:hypothetical protein
MSATWSYVGSDSDDGFGMGTEPGHFASVGQVADPFHHSGGSEQEAGNTGVTKLPADPRFAKPGLQATISSSAGICHAEGAIVSLEGVITAPEFRNTNTPTQEGEAAVLVSGVMATPSMCRVVTRTSAKSSLAKNLPT